MSRHIYISMIRGHYMVKVGTKYIGMRKNINDAIKLRNNYCKENGIIIEYHVYVNNQLEKVYNYRIQAIIYLMMKGHIYSGYRDGLFYGNNCLIKEKVS